MRQLTVREANQRFSRLIADVEAGQTVVITKNGRAVAEIRPRFGDPRSDPVHRAAHERMMRTLRSFPRSAQPVGPITEDDKYGDAPL